MVITDFEKLYIGFI